MSKTVQIPGNMNPYVVEINGVKYSYEAGTTQEVPDEVATFIENLAIDAPKQGVPTESSGGVAFKSFNLKLSDDATMRLVDMGNDVVYVDFRFSNDANTETGLMYTLPTDDEDFNAFMSGKLFTFSVHPVVTVYGENLMGMYAHFPFIGLLGGADTELQGHFQFACVNTDGINGDKLQQIHFSTVMSPADMSMFA